ncbi:MAG: hypothetical protein HOH58_08395 [Opitutaceae bacterium]|jgi:hypothetical protein|nr:hypothetical protein [Opitutaceae bacterium]
MLVSFIILLVLSAIVGYVGKDRKFGFWGYFFFSVLFTPIIGLIITFASDKRPAPEVASA